MKLKPEQLTQHLQQAGSSLAAVYLLSGDEPLLVQEAADQIRQSARDAGFSERVSYQADNNFPWENFLDEANSLSLFAERKILEINLLSGKPGTRGTEALLSYCEHPSPDNVLLITTPRLDGSAQKAKWFKTIETIGATLTFWPVEAEQLPQWITQRCRRQGLNLSQDAAVNLAERVEGNLLAAVQEIEKLKLLVDTQQPISADQIDELVADSARFDVFSLVDFALKGDLPRCLRMLDGVKSEGTDANAIVWALSKDIRMLLELKQQNGGQPPNDAQLQKHRIWGKRKSLVNKALQRLSPHALEELLQLCNLADKTAKGIENQSSWLVLSQIFIKLAR